MKKLSTLSLSFILMLTAGTIFAASSSSSSSKKDAKKLPIKGPDMGDFPYTMQNKGEAIQLPQVIPMGMLSGYCRFKLGDAKPTVVHVIKGGILDEGGVQVGDIIISINGTELVDKFTAEEFDGGRGPQEALGYGIEESLGRSGKMMTMDVLRAGMKKQVSLKLPDLEPYGPNYPFEDEGLDYANMPLDGSLEVGGKEPKQQVAKKEPANKGKKPRYVWTSKYKPGQPVPCERSERMLNALTKKLVEAKGDRNKLGGQVLTGLSGLALLGSWDLSYLPHIKDFAEGMKGIPIDNNGLPAWGLNYGTSFLCEYYLGTLDKSVLPDIEERMTVSEDWTWPNGKHGHGKAIGYKGAGINIITSHHFMNFGLARKTGVDKVPLEKIIAVAQHLKNCRSGRGSVGYISACSGTEASGITGMTAIGFELLSQPLKYSASEVAPLTEEQRSLMHKDAIICANFNSPSIDDPDHERYRVMRNSHANSLFAMHWGCSAAVMLRHSKSDGGYRKVMDYWRWYYSLGEAPEGSKMVRYYIPSKGNTGGDGYLGYDLFNTASMGVVYATGKQGLQIHGNKETNWYNKEALLKRQGKWEKVKNLLTAIDKLEKEKAYRKAYEKILELKEVDADHEYVYRKPRDWSILANNDINITLPIITSKDYYRSEKRLKFAMNRYGDVLAPRAKFFYDKVMASDLAKRQIKDARVIDEQLDKVARRPVEATNAIKRIEALRVKYESEATGFARTCQDIINDLCKQHKLTPPKIEDSEA